MLSKIARYLLRNNENFKKLDSLLDDPKKWKYDGYCIYHENGLGLWVVNGSGHLRIHEPEIELPYLMRLALWRKVNLIKKGVSPDRLTELLKNI